jgi:plastocyanin
MLGGRPRDGSVPSSAVRGVYLLVGLGLVAAGCGSDSNTTTTGIPAENTPSVPKPAKQVVVTESEFRLDPPRADGGSEGLVTIKIVNEGKLAHALAVDGPNGLVELDGRVEPGATATLEADLDKPGTYTMYCPLDGHRAKGMSASITVGGSNPARGAEPSQTSTTTTSTTPTQTQTTQTQTQTETQTETQTVTTPSTTRTSTTPTATTGTPSPGGY